VARIAVSLILALAILSPGGALAKSPSPRSITIQKVSLSNASGQWKTVVQPDKLVDLDKDEPGLSFFNNGRVDPGKYLNFEVVFVRTSEGASKRITSRRPLAPPFEVKRGSFIGVWFQLSESDLSVEKLEVVVDEAARIFGAEDLLEEKSRASF
jgi:hypothetical protein